MTREEAIKQFMMNQMSNRSEDLGFYLLGEIYDDFESRTCENCEWYQTHTYQSALGTKETEVTVTRCQKHKINWGKDFGCVDFVSTDTKGEEDD